MTIAAIATAFITLIGVGAVAGWCIAIVVSDTIARRKQ